MKMDETWIPSMPIASWKNSTSRGKEISGFKSWQEQFSGWLCLIHDAHGPELREAIHLADPFYFLMAAWLNEGRYPGGHPSVSTNCISIEANGFCVEITTVHVI